MIKAYASQEKSLEPAENHNSHEITAIYEKVLFMNADIPQRLINFNQEHILKHLDLVSNTEKQALFRDIEQIDLAQLANLYESYRLMHKVEKRKKFFQEVDTLSFNQTQTSEKQKRRLYSLGEDYLREGRVSIFLVAGGQGTRLGFQGPKGCYPISPVKTKSLFQLFAESIRALQHRYGNPLQWYIMTSQENNLETCNFFKQNNFFGLTKETVHFLIQRQIPSLNLEGKLIISQGKRIFKNPNGHGGSIFALHDSRALQEMAQRGIDEIFYFQVDNPLAKIADPLFIGAHVEQQAEMSTKAVKKVDPAEKVGLVGEIDGRLGCIEYSELSQKEAQERRKNGELRFNSANIAIHMLNREFVEKLNTRDNFRLPYHFAVKSIECLEVDGNRIIPKKIDGIKFEMFIFDALRFAERSVTLQVSREEEFSPIKNKTGVDSPETARKAMIKLFTRWLKSSNKISSIPDGLVIEISPLYALDEETFKKKFFPPSHILSPFYIE